jgi:RluA family pseudouridine synthase
MSKPNNFIRLPLTSGTSVELPIVYEDDVLLALDKPSGLMIAPDTYDKEKPNLMSAIRRALDTGASWVRERGLSTLANVHRLDADTSGLLLLAKTREALRALAAQFNDRSVGKCYLAFVEGEPDQDEFRVEMKIGPHPARPWLQVERRHGGRSTLTNFRVLEKFRFPYLRTHIVPTSTLRNCSLVQCEPQTGRTHQIRVHLRYAGNSIVGDALYGQGPKSFVLLSQLKKGYKQHGHQAERPLLGRLALHAERLIVKHPVTNQPLELIAPLPKDFEVALKYLRKYCRGQVA